MRQKPSNPKRRRTSPRTPKRPRAGEPKHVGELSSLNTSGDEHGANLARHLDSASEIAPRKLAHDVDGSNTFCDRSKRLFELRDHPLRDHAVCNGAFAVCEGHAADA